MRICKKTTVLVLVLALVAGFSFFKSANAAPLTALSDMMTRVQKSEASSHDISFTLSASNTFAAGETITIDFHEDDSDFTVAGAASAIADFDFNDGTERTIVGVDGDCTGHSGTNDVSVGINDTTGVVTFTACASLTASSTGATVNVEYGTAASGGTNRVTNPGTAATYVLDIDETTDDASKIAIAVIDDDTVQMTATVDPSITFSLSATSSAFDILIPGAIDTADTNITLTVGTNANTGYSITVRDQGSGTNPGLYNSASSSLIGSGDESYNDTADLSVVSSGYGIQASCTAGCTTGTHIASRWRQGSDTVGGLEIADTNLVTYSSALTANHTLQIVHKAKAAAFTPAGAYSDQITYIATGNF